MILFPLSFFLLRLVIIFSPCSTYINMCLVNFRCPLLVLAELAMVELVEVAEMSENILIALGPFKIGLSSKNSI